MYVHVCVEAEGGEHGWVIYIISEKNCTIFLVCEDGTSEPDFCFVKELFQGIEKVKFQFQFETPLDPLPLCMFQGTYQGDWPTACTPSDKNTRPDSGTDWAQWTWTQPVVYHWFKVMKTIIMQKSKFSKPIKRPGFSLIGPIRKS